MRHSTTKLIFLLTAVMVVALWFAGHLLVLEPARAEGTRIIRVDPPAGNPAADRFSIAKAVAQARPGDIIQFAPGTYVIGLGRPPFTFDFLPVPVPGITLEGHPDGTILKGGDFDPASTFPGQYDGLALIGGGQTFRNFTCENFSNACLILGRLLQPSKPGGYRVENCIFRDSLAGLGVFLQAEEVSHVTNNTFINIGVGLSLFGQTVRFHYNDLSAPQPENVPFFLQPITAAIARGTGFQGPSENNVFENNRVTGYADAFVLDAFAGGVCRHNVIRDNVVMDQRVFTPFDGGTLAFLLNEDGVMGVMEENHVYHNTLLGAQGAGIITVGATRTRITGNMIRDVTSVPDYDPLGFLGLGGVNRSGTGIWIGPGSRENQIHANQVSNTGLYDILLEGDCNLVVKFTGTETVQDLGQGNRIVGGGAVAVSGFNNALAVTGPGGAAGGFPCPSPGLSPVLGGLAGAAEARIRKLEIW